MPLVDRAEAYARLTRRGRVADIGDIDAGHPIPES
jgi:hypothetical protein